MPDERLERVAETLRSSAVVHETIEFHDIAGLVPGASQGEGLGNQFLGAIRETDAICHVVRAHERPGCPTRRGGSTRVADIELVETELLAADLETAERRLERVTKLAQVGRRRGGRRARLAGGGGRRPRPAVARCARCPVPEAAAEAPRKLQALTAKPVLYVVNVDEGERRGPRRRSPRTAAAAGAVAVAVSARIESELAELGDAAEAAAHARRARASARAGSSA